MSSSVRTTTEIRLFFLPGQASPTRRWPSCAGARVARAGRPGAGRRPLAGRAAGYDPGSRPLPGRTTTTLHAGVRGATSNALPQFHDRDRDGWTSTSSHVVTPRGRAALIMTHGWPGSVIESLETVALPTDSTRARRPRRGRVLPGAAVLARLRLLGRAYCSAGRTVASPRVGERWAALLHVLRHPGGDVGAAVTGRDGPPGPLRGWPARYPLASPCSSRGDRHQGPTAYEVRAGTRGARRAQRVHDGRLRLLPGELHLAGRSPAPADSPAGYGLDAGPRHGQLLQDLPRYVRRRAWALSPGQHRRQHHAVLAGRAPVPAAWWYWEFGRFLVRLLRLARLLRRSRFRPACRRSPARSGAAPQLGRDGSTDPTTSTRPTWRLPAAWKSPACSPRRSAARSGHPERIIMSSTSTRSDIRPFHVEISDEALDDLRRRIAATQWPDKADRRGSSQGVPLATIQKLAHYWMTDYDWRECEATLNALPQFITEIDGLDISTSFSSFAARGHAAAGRQSTAGQLDHRAAEDHRPLTGIPRRTASESDACYTWVVPSMPGYGFGGSRWTGTGWGPERMGLSLGGTDEAPRLHPVRRPRRRLGRDRRRPDGLAGTRGAARHPHNMPATVPARRRQGTSGAYEPPPAGLSAEGNGAPMSSW